LPAAANLTNAQTVQLTKLALRKTCQPDCNGYEWCSMCGKNHSAAAASKQAAEPSMMSADVSGNTVLEEVAGLTSQLTFDNVLHLFTWAATRK
jgi:hypothetical protein